MSDDIENQLRRALRPVEPPAGFAERVMRALPERREPATVVPLTVVQAARPASAWRRFSVPAAIPIRNQSPSRPLAYL